MLSELGRRPVIGGNEGSFGDELEKELGLLLREQRRESDDHDRELNIFRSGSAPPTVEGSLSAVGNLFNNRALYFQEFSIKNNNGGSSDNNGSMSEEELRSDPAYLSYYYSNVNLNPRLPPPLLSKEDWRFTQRLQGGSGLGGIGDKRKVNNRIGSSNSSAGISLFSMPPGFNLKKQENHLEKQKVLNEWDGDGLIGLPNLGLGTKQKSLADILQDDLSRVAPESGHPSRPASRNAFDGTDPILNSAEAELAQLQAKRDLLSTDALGSGTSLQSTSSYSYAAVLSRSTTPDPQRLVRTPSPVPAPIGVGRAGNSEKRNSNNLHTFNGDSSQVNDSADLVSALTSMNLSNVIINEEVGSDPKNSLFNVASDQYNSKENLYLTKSNSSRLHTPSVAHSSKISRSHSDVASNNPYGGGMIGNYQNVEGLNSSFSNYNFTGYSSSLPVGSGQAGNYNLPPLYENAAASFMSVPGMEPLNFGQMGNQIAVNNAIQGPFVDPVYLQYLRNTEYASAQVGAYDDPSLNQGYMSNSYVDLVQKAYLGSLLSPQKSQYGISIGGKSGNSNHQGYYGNPEYGVGFSYPGSPLNPVIQNSPFGPGSPVKQGDPNMGYLSLRRLHLGAVDGGFASSLLEEFKSNKTKCFELSDIKGHVVAFSADQYGSRFIQQKLETATSEEKNMVFQEIFLQALSLMTDVFGNYVIQKFFEHGMSSQRREMAEKLLGHVLTLSLQMYGCRVIQKAIEVVDLDQKIIMVKELDGNIMRCVRDQNGNHVIQKCIECVPEDHIQFIVTTFFDQVVTLSTHPYGCRVVQRVLEHCKDPKTQSKVMDEILGSVSMLAQDQYGNYVVQHVLEHGNPNERSIIIQELAGKIVQMSQQKFASNVVEKCLTFGDANERKLLVSEMLGSTDENEPLQAMMKDQFGNYVVQKVLETCSDQERELIMSRIKVHLNALKKYTYGKHIVARVEKLVAAGERRIAAQSVLQPPA